jgi:hypothetical protein
MHMSNVKMVKSEFAAKLSINSLMTLARAQMAELGLGASG